jgi:Concanavalin A-like lectin/glucanases superfamily
MFDQNNHNSDFGRTAQGMRLRAAVIVASTLLLLTTTVGYADLTSGLVGYWSFDNPADLGHDDSGTGNNGSPMGGVTATSGVMGGAIHLNGSGYISVPDSPSLDLSATGGITISAFIRIEPSSDQFGIAVKESSSSYPSTIAYEFAIRGLRDVPTMLVSDGSTDSYGSFSDVTLADSTWHHVAATWVAGGDIRMYLDGVLKFQGNPGNPVYLVNNTSDPVLIGAFRWNVSGIYRYMTGDMDEVRIYNRALTADEIMDLACNAVSVPVDIKPGSCPNPLNVKDQGMLPVAILGSQDFDVSTVDPASVRLEGVAPVRSSYEDVAAPVRNKTNECDCTTEGPDGYLGLVLQFRAQDIVASLGQVNDGDTFLLTLTGEDLSGTPIEGTDCVVIVGKGNK